MHETIERLIAGDHEIAGFYAIASQKWNELFSEADGSVADWAKWITNQQISFFEWHCGGRNLGQEVMVWSAFGMLYSTREGFGSNLAKAVQLVKAFAASSVSMEVKSYARRAAKFYSLHDIDEIEELLTHPW